jgi:hypothetical protein
MVNEEIYILTKHAKFQADYIENLPIYRRRFFIHLLQEENEKLEEMQDRERSKYKH